MPIAELKSSHTKVTHMPCTIVIHNVIGLTSDRIPINLWTDVKGKEERHLKFWWTYKMDERVEGQQFGIWRFEMIGNVINKLTIKYSPHNS